MVATWSMIAQTFGFYGRRDPLSMLDVDLNSVAMEVLFGTDRYQNGSISSSCPQAYLFPCL